MRRVIGIILAILGLAGFVTSLAWKGSIEPKLVKYPTDVDETPRYQGTVSIFLDTKTYAPLAQPLVVPLTVERNIKALADQSTSSEVVVKESIALDASPAFKGGLDAQYVMNRRTAENVASDKAWAFIPENIVDRSGSWRLSFPFNTPAEPRTIYKNEVAATYQAQPVGSDKVEGLSVERFSGVQDKPLPVSPAYLAQLDKLTPLPRQLTLDQLKPTLKQFGLDVDALLPVLLPKLQPADVQTLVALAGRPIALSYALGFSGQDAVEKRTGAVVQVSDVKETLYAQPDPQAQQALKAIFDKYPNVPEAVAASQALDKVASTPIKVFENSYSQTPDSVKEVAKTVRSKSNQVKLAESTIPNVLRWGGLVLFVAGLALALWPRRKPAAQPAEPTAVDVSA